MRKHKITRKLTLSKRTVSNLEEREMNEVNGGRAVTYSPTCVSYFDCRTDEFCSCKNVICK